MKPVIYKAVFDRDLRLCSKETGYCMHFKKGVPQQIPHRFREEVINAGGRVSGDESLIAAQKGEELKKLLLEKELLEEKAKAALAEQKLAEMEAKAVEEKKDKEAKEKEAVMLKEKAKMKLRAEKIEKEAAKELEEEEKAK